MKRLALRTLQFAIAVAISILGRLIATHSRGDDRGSRGRQGSCRQAQDHLVDVALQQIIKLIKEYVVLNSNYNDDLSGLNNKLL